ncbi:MAG: hypothetical protein R2697_00650 [Ilumatobacteraceae bacterium]
MNIGMLTGIQVDVHRAGRRPRPADFAWTFSVSAAAAAVGVSGALLMDRRR